MYRESGQNRNSSLGRPPITFQQGPGGMKRICHASSGSTSASIYVSHNSTEVQDMTLVGTDDESHRIWTDPRIKFVQNVERLIGSSSGLSRMNWAHNVSHDQDLSTVRTILAENYTNLIVNPPLRRDGNVIVYFSASFTEQYAIERVESYEDQATTNGHSNGVSNGLRTGHLVFSDEP